MSTVATQGPVEARSLSSITAIASNPPRLSAQSHPRETRPFSAIHRPGPRQSRCPHETDIFLSPLKPPTKSSVSAEAINASLYYLHVATPDDDALLQEVEQEREEEAQRRREALEAAGADADDPSQREFLRMNKVRRKPVGGKDLDQENEGPMQQNSVPQALAELPAAPPPLPRRPNLTPEVSTEYMSFTGTSVANAQQHPTNRLIPVPLPVEQISEKQLGPRKFHRQVCVSKPFDDSNGTRHPSDLKSGYYVFKSPWNGTCTFSSSVNGRSLKCKHMISGPGHAPISEGENPNPAVTVAEIRFNTPFQAANLHYHTSIRTHGHSLQSPTHNLPPSPDSPTHPNLATSKRNSFSALLNPNTYSRPRAQSGPNAVVPENSRQPMSPAHILRRTSLPAQRFARQTQFQHHRRSESTSSGGADSDEDRLDLSLARELAGGGMRGKSAKLGKLIVEDEGIKMLDLVVAACMAVWWRGYYH
ncbi:uncharacterized protein N7477_010009 [Penicillium maclennaniae]|uniref:uncharacterized protein n=1 Tax=Penicillium maclennaniae TaxID=1343394 RepID=UPI0025419214|nr:uncharacterized protein N7477_010009 [Penicillium maclennaniae]KAJ5662393.1 hypothetical protein N7477_010009 [Penicillium maclennaniae]